MSDSDITFTVGLDTSEAEMKLAELDKTLEQTLSQDGEVAIDDGSADDTIQRSPRKRPSYHDIYPDGSYTELDADPSIMRRHKEMLVDSDFDFDTGKVSGKLRDLVETSVTDGWSEIGLDPEPLNSDIKRFLDKNVPYEYEHDRLDFLDPDVVPEDRGDSFEKEYQIDTQIDNDSGERFSRADGSLRADRMSKKVSDEDIKQEEVSDELKEQNREYNDQILKLGKIAALLAAIKGAIEAAKKLWNSFKDISANVKKDTGFITQDLNGTLDYGNDRTHSQVAAGIRAYGDSAPFSEQAYNSLLEKVNRERQKVSMGGQPDEKFVQYIQWMNDKMGTSFNAVDLLAGDERTTTDIVNQMLKSVEEYLSSNKFVNQGELGKNQDMQAITEVLGGEITNGIAGNIVVNKQIGERVTAIERILSKGAAGGVNLHEDVNTRRLNEATANFASALDIVRKQLLDLVATPLVSAINKITQFARFISGQINTQSEEERERDERANASLFELVESGRVTVDNGFLGWKGWYEDRVKDKNIGEDVKDRKNIKPVALDKIDSFDDAIDFYSSVIMSQPDIAGAGWNNFTEGAVQRAKISEIQEKGLYDYQGHEVSYEDEYTNKIARQLRKRLSTDEAAKFKETYKGQEGLDTLMKYLYESADFVAITNKYFGEGGELDSNIHNKEGASDYFRNVLDGDALKYFLMSIVPAIANQQYTDNRVDSGSYITKEVNGEKRVVLVLDTTSWNGKKTEIDVTNDLGTETVRVLGQ